MTTRESALVVAARARLQVGDGSGALEVLAAAPDPDDPIVLELSARASYLGLAFPEAIDLWERAYAAYRRTGDQLGAVRVARTLGYAHGAVMGDRAVMNGWLARARTMLGGEPDSPEHGWVSLNVGMFASDRDERDRLFREALEIGRSCGDTDLEILGLAYLGANLVHADRTEEGMQLLDESLAAVAGSEVDDYLVIEEVFCQLFSACEYAHDVGRADEWIRVGRSMAERRNLPAVAAFCHTHYGGVLTAAGRWPEADSALTEAVRLWGLGYRALQAGALIRLADLRVRQGRVEEAAVLLEGLETHLEAARPLAAIHLARGNARAARDVLGRALHELPPASASAVPLLSLLVDIALLESDLDGARGAVEALMRCATDHESDYVRAVAAFARGQVCLADGSGDPLSCLREALTGFGRAQLPMELARARLALAGALRDGRRDDAIAEARAALESFERLQAARDADAAAALLRALGSSASSRGRGGAGVLTAREAEVLELVGHGLSNPEISERLFISRKTVEHHVGNILSKLGLRSRAEAAAHAARAAANPGGE